MKILQVTPFLGEQFGGTERFCNNLSLSLARKGHEVTIFTSKTLPSTPSFQKILYALPKCQPIKFSNDKICFLISRPCRLLGNCGANYIET